MWGPGAVAFWGKDECFVGPTPCPGFVLPPTAAAQAIWDEDAQACPALWPKLSCVLAVNPLPFLIQGDKTLG